ncbi:hypothetical protein JHK86_036624 [Glycine max]|nr:hypothetical protein JHK86_036624 [Glycine max]
MNTHVYCFIVEKTKGICALFKLFCALQNVFLISHKRQIIGQTFFLYKKKAKPIFWAFNYNEFFVRCMNPNIPIYTPLLRWKVVGKPCHQS